MIFGRMIQFDERSRQHPIRALIASTTPRSYTWRCNQTLDQGPDGACVGFAWAHEMIARPSEVKGINAEFAKETVYWTAQKLDHIEGGSYPDAIIPYEGTTVIAGAKAAMTTGLIGGYRWAFGLDDLIIGVGRHGPAVIGVWWYEGMMEPDRSHTIHVTGDRLGGHAVLVRGVNVTTRMFKIRNSWGSSWGNNGDCLISFDDMAQLLLEEGEACFATGRHTSMPIR